MVTELRTPLISFCLVLKRILYATIPSITIFLHIIFGPNRRAFCYLRSSMISASPIQRKKSSNNNMFWKLFRTNNFLPHRQKIFKHTTVPFFLGQSKSVAISTTLQIASRSTTLVISLALHGGQRNCEHIALTNATFFILYDLPFQVRFEYFTNTVKIFLKSIKNGR